MAEETGAGVILPLAVGGTALALDMLRVPRGGVNHTHSSFGIRTSSWREPLSSRKYHPAGESYRSLIIRSPKINLSRGTHTPS